MLDELVPARTDDTVAAAADLPHGAHDSSSVVCVQPGSHRTMGQTFSKPRTLASPFGTRPQSAAPHSQQALP